eukprot:6436740-Pyramimonas_sp.AAC.1
MATKTTTTTATTTTRTMRTTTMQILMMRRAKQALLSESVGSNHSMLKIVPLGPSRGSSK